MQLFAGPESRAWGPRRLLLVLWATTWLPVAVLDLVTKDGLRPESFLRDAAAQARLLVALPLFLLARPLVETLLAHAVRGVFEAGLVHAAAQAHIAGTLRRRARRMASPFGLVLLVLLAGALSFLDFRLSSTRGELTWRTDGDGLSLAGLWYFSFTNTFYRLIVLRWVWGFGTWFASMCTLARGLRPDPLHPDRQGGLERLTTSHASFCLVLLGASSSIAGAFVNQVLYRGATFATLQPLMVATVVLLPLPVLAALLPLVLPLRRARHDLLTRYGRVAAEQERAFAEYWFTPRTKTPHELLKSEDFSAAADLGTNYQVALTMLPFPLQRPALLALLLGAALPMLPVLLLLMPTAEVLKELFSVL